MKRRLIKTVRKTETRQIEGAPKNLEIVMT